jgi:hypothetical protein
MTLGPDDRTPTEGWGAKELRLARFKAINIADDEPTGRQCPCCDGQGLLYESTGVSYRALACPLCEQNGWVSAEVAREWSIRNLSSKAQSIEAV